MTTQGDRWYYSLFTDKKTKALFLVSVHTCYMWYWNSGILEHIR